MTGLLLAGILTAGYFFASPWPRKAAWFKALTALKWINDFTVFYISHIALTASVVTLLIIHPYPCMSVLNTPRHKGNTWAYLVAGLIIYLLGIWVETFR